MGNRGTCRLTYSLSCLFCFTKKKNGLDEATWWDFETHSLEKWGGSQGAPRARLCEKEEWSTTSSGHVSWDEDGSRVALPSLRHTHLLGLSQGAGPPSDSTHSRSSSRVSLFCRMLLANSLTKIFLINY